MLPDVRRAKKVHKNREERIFLWDCKGVDSDDNVVFESSEGQDQRDKDEGTSCVTAFSRDEDSHCFSLQKTGEIE